MLITRTMLLLILTFTAGCAQYTVSDADSQPVGAELEVVFPKNKSANVCEQRGGIRTVMIKSPFLGIGSPTVRYVCAKEPICEVCGDNDWDTTNP